MNSADKKLLMGVFGVIFVVTLIFRHELLPFLFPIASDFPGVYRSPPPTVIQVDAPSAPSDGGVMIKLTGTNFGSDVDNIEVLINSVHCKEVDILSVTELICRLPAGYGKDVPVIVSVNGVVSKEPYHFSYDPPSISAVHLSNFQGKTSGHELVTILGSNFGPSKGRSSALKVMFGSFQALDVEVLNANALEVITPRGFGRDLPVVVELGGQKSSDGESKIHYISYAPPVVESIDPETGPTTGGSILYIYGNNFGSHAAFPKVFIDDRPCVFVTWRSSTLLECVLPSGTGRSKFVKVVVGGQSNGKNTLFSYDAPSVSSIYPDSGPTAGNTIVTIYGANFGTEPSTPRDITFAGSHCGNSNWISDTEVSCITPPGTGSDVTVGIVVDEQQSEKKPLWSYGEPSIMKVIPNHGPVSGGTLVTIQGANFGTDASQLDGISIDATPCTKIQWLSINSLTCTTPAGAGKNLPVRVTISGVIGRNFLWSYDAATLVSVTPATGPAEGGTLITITGKNFGTVDTPVDVFVGGSKCAVSHVISDSQVTCLLPAGSGSKLTVRVVTDGIPSELVGGFSYNKPRILDIDPAFVSTSGSVVTIFGESFGTSSSDATVMIGTSPCPVVSNTKSMIICRAPAGTGLNIAVTVTIDGQASEPFAKFNYEGPVVRDVEPNNGGAGTLITVFGSNFGLEESDVKVFIGEKECTISSWLGEQRVTCIVPEQPAAANLPIKVSINGQASTIDAEVVFTYGDPRTKVTQISPAFGPLKPSPVTITGVNLKKEYLTVEFGDGNKGTIQLKTDTQVIVLPPPSTNAGVVSVYVKDDGDAVLGTASLVFEYKAAPTTTTTTPTTTTTKTTTTAPSVLPDPVSATAQPTADAKDRLELHGNFASIPDTLAFDIRIFNLVGIEYQFEYKCRNPLKATESLITCDADQNSAGHYAALSITEGSSTKLSSKVIINPKN